MRKFSQRRVFTIFMTIFATTFVIAITGQVLGGEADLFADILKISILIAVSTAVIGFTVWTLIHLKNDSILGGALAGLLTAILIIPLPTFVWTLKTETLSAYKDTTESFLMAVSLAIPPSISRGLYTFVDITKASLIAMIASMILGGVVARYVKSEKPTA